MSKSTTRVAAVMIASATALGTVAGCGGGGNGDGAKGNGAAKTGGLKFAYIQKNGDQQYFLDEAAGARAAAKQLGATVNVQNVALNADQAVNAVDTAIAAGVDGLAVVLPDQKLGPGVAQKAANAKVPLVATDDALKDASGGQVPFVGFDGTAMGHAVGKEAAKLYNASGWKSDAGSVRALDVEVPELSVCNDRTNTAESDFLAQTGFDKANVIKVPYDGTEDKAIESVAPKVTANSSIKHWVVWSCNDEGVAGALRALTNGGVQPQGILGVGLGANLACGEWKAGKPSGFKAALFIDGHDVGAEAIRVLHDAVANDKPLPKASYAKTQIVTPKNYEQAGVKCH